MALSMGVGLVALPEGEAEAGLSKFRKCKFKVMVVGRGLPRTEVPGARFTAWGRSNLASRANRTLNSKARLCVERAIGQNGAELPQVCRFNPNVHREGASDSGISNFSLTRAKDALKRTICEQPRQGRRTDGHDTRTIQGELPA